MLNVIELDAYGTDKQAASLRSVAHARLLRQVPAPVARPAQFGQRGPVFLVAAVLLLALLPAEVPVEAAPPVSVTTTTPAATLAPTGGSGCWVTGDLVGDVNPAVIAAAFCGH